MWIARRYDTRTAKAVPSKQLFYRAPRLVIYQNDILRYHKTGWCFKILIKKKVFFFRSLLYFFPSPPDVPPG